MKHEDERSMSVSPPINNNSTLFSGLHPAFGMFAPQLNFLSSLPMPLRAQALASGLFPSPSSLFGTWPPSPSCSSPPKSPISPASMHKRLNNNHIVSTTSEFMAKKANKRKPLAKKETNTISVKKDLLSPSSDISMEIMPGLISPPTSGSSPNSTGSLDAPAVASTTRDPSREKVFTCKICNRSFGYKHVLQNHERTHTGEKPFECGECHKRFTRDHHLKTHMRLHTGEKPYSCTHCDRQFVQVANLRRHLRVHTGEKPYTCDICHLRFSDSNQLKAHSMLHNGEKPFNCERCHQKFRRRHHLLHHKCDTFKPTMSPPIFDLRFDMKSELSNESMDLSKSMKSFIPPILRTNFVDPPQLDQATTKNEMPKIRIPQIMHLPGTCMLPEQTEPEDLSMHSPRSPLTQEEIDQLDDAYSLNLRQREHKLQSYHGNE